MKYLELLGRLFFAAIFLMSGSQHFTQQMIGYGQASGVPLASFAVPVSGLIAIVGGILILLGWKAKIGAGLIIVFLIPVTLMMHNFWSMEGQEQMTQRIMFMKNLSMLGGAFIMAFHGAGPLSLDNRKR